MSDQISAALDAARLALESVTPADQTVTAKVNQDLALSSIASFERAIRFLSWEKERQARVAASRADREQVNHAPPKPVATATPAPNKRK